MNTFVYFVTDGEGRIKIGYSTNPRLRLQALQTAAARPLALMGAFPGDLRTERALHARFAAHHVGNEWFRSDAELLAAVTDILDLYEPYADRIESTQGPLIEDRSLDEQVLRRRLSQMLRARWPDRTDRTLEALGIAPARSVRNWLWCLTFPNGIALLRIVNAARLSFLRDLLDDPSRELIRAARIARRERLEAELASLDQDEAREASVPSGVSS